MYVETKKIIAWNPGGTHRNTPVDRPEGLKQLNPKTNGFGRPSFHRQPAAESQTEYFAKPYGLNTKYIVSMEDDDIVGVHVSLANGTTVWVDETVAGLTVQSNRR